MTVHRSAETWSHQFVVSTLLKRQLKRKVYPVHRLDHRTSGALIFAFDSKICIHLQQLLNTGRKRYLCLVRGEWTRPESEILIDHPINMNGKRREAQTLFRVLSTQKQPRASLLIAEPKTGRNHQIRKHAYHIGHPIIGDTAHGDTTINRWWRENRNLDRLALHCFHLDFTQHSMEGDNLDIIAPLPEDLTAILKAESQLWQAALLLEPRLDIPPIDLRYKKQEEDEEAVVIDNIHIDGGVVSSNFKNF